jgi:hypothetical protein
MYKKRLFFILILAITPLLINGYINTHIYQTPLLYWTFELLSWIAIPIAVYLLSRNYLDLKLSDIGIHHTIFDVHSWFLIVLTSIFLAPVIFLVYKYSYLFFEGIFQYSPLFEYDVMIPQNGLLKFVVLLYFSISAGIVEEFYRGLVYKFSSYFANPTFMFVLISPIFFALPHWENGIINLCATYVVGLFFALIFLVSKNLIPLIIGHIYTDMLWFN